MSTHSAIAVVRVGETEAINVPTETPRNGEILIKVEYSSLIPFDTYMVDLGYSVTEFPTILGFNASGTVVQLGDGVTDLAVGDRVTAFSYLSSRSKGMQQYTIQPRAVVAKLGLPIPQSLLATSPPPLANAPIPIYGAGATSGQYMIQLLHFAGYKNILATASTKHHDFLRSLGATNLFDYRNPELTNEIAKAVGQEGKVAIAVDCIATEKTLEQVAQAISPSGTVAVLLPVKKTDDVVVDDKSKFDMNPEGRFSSDVRVLGVGTFTYLIDAYLKENLMPIILPACLGLGVVKPSRVRLLDHGTFKDRVKTGLDLLRKLEVRGEKLVVAVAE